MWYVFVDFVLENYCFWLFCGEIERGHALKQSLERERKENRKKNRKDYHSSF
jgi:hypothetical protein